MEGMYQSGGCRLGLNCLYLEKYPEMDAAKREVLDQKAKADKRFAPIIENTTAMRMGNDA